MRLFDKRFDSSLVLPLPRREIHAKIHEATGPEVLRSLIETQGLRQSKLPRSAARESCQKSSGERELNRSAA
jgi:hypothetical protein